MADNNIKSVSRKKFVKWGGLGSLGLLIGGRFAKIFTGSSDTKPGKPTTVKMLTEDGKLVEVDMSKLPKERTKISNEEVHSWIKS
jgi:hypothetical protein